MMVHEWWMNHGWMMDEWLIDWGMTPGFRLLYNGWIMD
jgi:hypothetical protein